MNPTVVLAFSGGLDTSFCVPYLKEQGYDVVTLFVSTGGASAREAADIERRATELGAREHVVEDAADELWDRFVTPFVMGGVPYQDQYPLLCSDRYAIVSHAAALAERIGAAGVAHGCTAMGNDQVRFDVSLKCLTDLPILAPIREIQGKVARPREYERAYLEERGFSAPASTKRYTINENLLGATCSGSEIDEFAEPGEGTYRMTAAPSKRPAHADRVTIGFEQGVAVSIDGRELSGPEILGALNDRLGIHGVGRGIYTGDTVLGLKGRIVYEAPGLTALLTAHRALEQTVLTVAQGAFKPLAARRWTELVYSGFFFDPLREDLEALIESTQRRVTGSATLWSHQGVCQAVAVDSPNKIAPRDAVYAQHAPWTAADAEGFIKLVGLSSVTAARREVAGV